MGFALVLMVMLMSFCEGGGGRGGSPPDPTELSVTIQALLAWFQETRGWNFLSGNALALQIDRHRGFFVHRRTATLTGSNSSLRVPPYTTLKAMLVAEVDAVEAFIATKLGTPFGPGTLTGGTDPASPPHFDLFTLAETQTTTPPMTQAVYAVKYTAARQRMVHSICWRAAALHPDEVWSAPGVLNPDVMNEILDRRLRVVEQMGYTIGLTSDPRFVTELHYPSLGLIKWTGITDADGPWNDGFIVRMFEYPGVPDSPEFNAAIGASHIGRPPDPRKQPGKPWYDTGSNLDYDVGPWGIYFKPEIAPDIQPNTADDYTVRIVPRNASRTGSAIFQDMFTPSPDLWHRSWIYCDMAMSACNIDALRFGLHRRHGNDAIFNALFTPAGYVGLGAFVGDGHDRNQLMADTHTAPGQPEDPAEPNDPHFDNWSISGRNLEVGDHFLFWNTFLYSSFQRGAWALENSYAMQVESDPITGGVSLTELEMQGHGASRRMYFEYQEYMIQILENDLVYAQFECEEAGTSTDSIDLYGKTDLLIRWDPYETFAAPGAWWAKVFFGHEGDRLQTLSQALSAMPAAMYNLPQATGRPPAGPGYNPPPAQPTIDKGWVLYPLFVPKINGGWTGYLTARATNTSLLPPALDKLKIDGSLVTGLFDKGVGVNFNAIKPRVLP